MGRMHRIVKTFFNGVMLNGIFCQAASARFLCRPLAYSVCWSLMRKPPSHISPGSI